MFLSEWEMRTSLGWIINLGDVHHQRIGWSSLYHGNIPHRYASNSLSEERVPPTPKSPSGSRKRGCGKTISSFREKIGHTGSESSIHFLVLDNSIEATVNKRIFKRPE